MKNQRNVVLILVVAVVVILAGAVSYFVFVPSSSTAPPPGPPGSAVCPSSGANAGAGNWTTYHQNNCRPGFEAEPNITVVRPQWGPSTLDGQVYAEPLVYGGVVFVATENDSVYAINASTGATLWRMNLGTPVPGSSLPCGDIDPSGITGTPVIDVATGTLYVVAYLNGPSLQHVLFGLDLATGSVLSHVVVDPSGAVVAAEQQRGALALANGYVYVPYGGLYGDCGPYHGWVVGAPVSGSGPLLSYQVPTHRQGGIWGTAGMAVAANGDLYVATGNGDSTTTFDHGDSVIELSPSLTELGYFAPTNWAQLNAGDTDLGSVAPTLLPNGDVFQIGKAGVGYLLSGTNLGGIGGQIATENVCGGAYGATARVGQSILVPCVDGVADVVAGASNLSVVWRTSAFDSGSPIVTANIVWSVNISTGVLLGFNVSNGQQVFSFSLGSVDHFITPAAAPGSLYVGAGNELYAFTTT